MKSKKRPLFCPYCGRAFQKKLIEGKERLYCQLCDEIYYENPVPAVTALVLNEENQILLGRRAVEPAKGGWCLPGGFMETGETIEEAALRELKEETGINGRIVSFVGFFYQESIYYGSIIIFGYRVEMMDGVLKADDDMEALQYFELDDLPEVAFLSHKNLIGVLKKQIG